MYQVTLIGAPNQERLNMSVLDSLRHAWGGGDAVWLSHAEAAEFPIEAIPSNPWQVWQDFQNMGIDMIVQPSAKRRKKMVLADMDSTMIQQECIDELADEVGVGDRVKEITARAMNGELDFEAALDERVALLAGQPAHIIDKVLKERIKFMPGGHILIATMKAGGAYAALVSGGFTAFTHKVAETLGFDEHHANTLLVEGGNLSGKVARPILGRQAKAEQLEKITAKLGLSENDVIAVGDGANDLGMLGRAGTGVALHAKPAVQVECTVRVNHGDLTALLFLQGYSRDEFCGL
jgi:phosphoserine phosphatase